MEQYITPERIANAIMQDNDFKGYYLIVEGPKDYKLYSKFFDKMWKIKESFGCENVKSVLSILRSRGFTRKIGIIDLDFNKILNTKIECNDLFYTDDHDIEVMMLKTKALENVMNVFCKKNAIENFIEQMEQNIRDIIFNLAKEIGYLKLTNKIHDLGLVFKPEKPDGNQIKYRDFISDKDLSFKGIEDLVQSVINYSANRTKKQLYKEKIIQTTNEISKNDYDIYQLVNGHDLTNILFLLMKKVLKSNSKMLNDFNCVEDSLILAYELSDFQKTELYKSLFSWSRESGIYIDNSLANQKLMVS